LQRFTHVPSIRLVPPGRVEIDAESYSEFGCSMGIQPAPYDAKQTLVPMCSRRFTRQRDVRESEPLVQERQHRLGRSAHRDCVVSGPKNFRPGRLFLAVRHLVHVPVTAMAGKMPGFLQNCLTNIPTPDPITGVQGPATTTNGCVVPRRLSPTLESESRRVSGHCADSDDYTFGSIVPAPQPSTQAPAVGAFDSNIKNPRSTSGFDHSTRAPEAFRCGNRLHREARNAPLQSV